MVLGIAQKTKPDCTQTVKSDETKRHYQLPPAIEICERKGAGVYVAPGSGQPGSGGAVASVGKQL